MFLRLMSASRGVGTDMKCYEIHLFQSIMLLCLICRLLNSLYAYCFCPFISFIYIYFFFKSGIDKSIKGPRHQRVLALHVVVVVGFFVCLFVCFVCLFVCFFNRGNTEGTNSSKLLCLLLVCVCFVSLKKMRQD